MSSKVITALLLLISIYRYYNSIGTSFSKDSLTITVVMMFISIAIFVFRSDANKKLRKNAYTISSIFLLSFIVVYFFEYIGFLVGEYETILSSKVLGSDANVTPSSICSLACLQAFLLGYYFVKKPFSKTISSDQNSKAITAVKKKDSHLIDRIVLLFAVSYFVVTPKAYFSGGYGEFMNEIGVSVASSLAATFVQAAQLAAVVIVIIKNKGNRVSILQYFSQYSKYFYIGWGFFMLLVLMSGDRGPVLYSLITYVSGYFIINQMRLSYAKAGLGIFVLAFFMAFMGVFRNQEGDFSLQKFAQVQEYRNDRFDGENPIFSNTRDLSICVETYRAQYEMMDAGLCFYGLGIVNRCIGIIPGLRFFLYPILGIDADKIDPAQLATQFLGIDCGAGNTCLGDTLINLGFLGTLLFTFLFGLLVKKMDLSLWTTGTPVSLFLFILSVYSLSVAVYVPRSHYFTAINVTAYAFLIVYIIKRYELKKSNNRIKPKKQSL